MATSNQANQPPSPSHLVGQSDRFAGKKFELVSPSLLLGRGGDCDIVLDDPQVSRHHARLKWEADNWFVEDLGSTNGTQVNGIPVTGQRNLLNPGGILSLGGVTFKLEMTGLQDTIVASHLRPQPAVPASTAPFPPPPVSPGPAAPAEKRTSLWMTLGGAGVLIVGLMVLILVGVVAWLLLSPGATQVAGLDVSIDFPASGAQVTEGDTIIIAATATDQRGLSRLEIWIDDTLAQTMPATTSSLAVNHP